MKIVLFGIFILYHFSFANKAVPIIICYSSYAYDIESFHEIVYYFLFFIKFRLTKPYIYI